MNNPVNFVTVRSEEWSFHHLWCRDPGFVESGLSEDEFTEDDTETTPLDHHVRTEEENPGTYWFQNLCTKSDLRCQGIVSRRWS